MPVSYINRRKEEYFVRAIPSKTGKMCYYVVKDTSKCDPKELLQEIPAGFEFHEIPNEAKVVFRKIPRYNITDSEVEIVAAVMKKHETVSDYIVEKGVDDITVYVGHADADAFTDWPELKDKKYLMQTYDDGLKFAKTGKSYHAQRFCYRSSHYGWITIESSRDLRYLAEKYCFHIDKESLFDFGIDY